MDREELVSLLEKYKDRPVIIGLSDEGQVLFGNIEGHWLFITDTNIVQVRVNSSLEGVYDIDKFNQQQTPFQIKYVPFELINYVRTDIANIPGDIQFNLEGLEPIGTSKSMDDIRKEIESNNVRKAMSPRGVINTTNVAPGSTYGKFSGSAISTEPGGVPKYMEMNGN